MLKYDFNTSVGVFEISPLWLEEEMEIAERNQYPRIRIRALMIIMKVKLSLILAAWRGRVLFMN